MSNPVDVHWFTSAMSEAPTLSGTAGTLIGVLDACLINGFGSVTLDSVTVASGIATASLGSGHGFLDHAVVLIEGATPSGLNGEKRITVTSSTVFTFDATGISDQTATGTITAKMAPVGWTKAYNGTNKAAYARSIPAATVMLLRVDDSPAQYPTLIMYESMTDVDTGSGGTTALYFPKSSTASTTARAWRLYADDYCFYLFGKVDGTYWFSHIFFGDIISCISPDAYGCSIVANNTASASAGSQLARAGYDVGSYLARTYTQLGAAISSVRYSHNASYFGYTGATYPNAAGNLFLCSPITVWESSALYRGVLPGGYSPWHTTVTLQPIEGQLITEVSGLPGRTLIVQAAEVVSSTRTHVALDLTGPWR